MLLNIGMTNDTSTLFVYTIHSIGFTIGLVYMTLNAMDDVMLIKQEEQNNEWKMLESENDRHKIG